MKSPLRSGLVVCFWVVLAACEGGGGSGKASDPAKPLAINLGDCTSSKVLFVSGPRPTGSDSLFADGAVGPTFDGSGAMAAPDPGGGSASGFGTIGHGTATGAGYGVGGGGRRGRTSAVPTVAIGQPVANGDLDKAIIRRYIKRNIQKIQYCYERQLLQNPGLDGTISTQFFIGPDGLVKSANASGVDPEVAACVADVIKSIEFPKPKGGGGVQVNYPFRFRRSGADVPTGSGSATPPPAQPPAAEEPPAPKHPAISPLTSIQGELEACLHKQSKTYGALVVDLAFDPKTNAVTDASVIGIDDKAAAACIAIAAKRITRREAGPATQRCSLAFGDMPIADVPTIQITDADVTFNTAVVDHPKAIVLDQSETWKVAALYEALDAWMKQHAPTATTVPIRGPGLIEPIDATPMKVVSRVLASAYAAGADFVLAAKTKTGWRALRDVHVPVVPVPIGTGGTWSGVRSSQPSNNEYVTMSILVKKSSLFIGVSRINEFQEIPGPDFAKLEAALKTHKASAFFADRMDVEIGADDDVSYGDLVKVIEIADRVGFGEWSVLPPRQLTAKPAL